MSRIHWIGTGLSSVPGLRRLLNKNLDLYVWNRTVEKANSLVGDLTKNIYQFNLDNLQNEIAKGDIVVSMLPGDWHVPIAKLCINHSANFVSSSYVSDEMKLLHHDSLEKNLIIINEVGLDPGIDHLMSHYLVNDYKNSKAYHLDNEIEFVSYCGGIPKNPNKFCYKFSWSPAGVLKALKSPAISIRNFQELLTERPWHQVEHFSIPSEDKEKFEVYPNRDSRPFIKQYDFEDEWKIKTFVRGTLRNLGWKEAWKEIFQKIDNLNLELEYNKLQAISDELWKNNSYGVNEYDRVVLNVSLRASKNKVDLYEKSYLLDAWGNENGSAMARLVSIPVALAVEAVINNNIAPGVSAAPKTPGIVENWLKEVGKEAQIFKLIDMSK